MQAKAAYTAIPADTAQSTPASQAPATVGAEAWNAVKERLRAMHGDATFRSWLKPLDFVSSRQGEVRLCVPTRFMREWVITHFAADIVSCWQQEDSSVRTVDVVVQQPLFSKGGFGVPFGVSSGVAVEGDSAAAGGANGASAARHKAGDSALPRPLPGYGAHAARHEAHVKLLEQDTLAALDPRFTFDNFVVGKPNELAYAAAQRVAESDAVAPGGNPLFLYGGVGLGKTHLMHAIAWHIRAHAPSRRVLYLSAEKFMYEFVRSLRDKNTMSFKEQFRSVDVLMVDDVQFICGKDSTQEEFFHTFNALVDQNKQVVITGDRSPSDLEGLEERIRSRLGWGLVADVHATTYELRLGILQSKAERLQCHVPLSVIEFLAQRIASNVRELEGALNRVVAHSTLVGKAITLETTQDVLRDLLRANDRRVTIDDIQRKVAEHFNIKVSDMYSARRSRVVARPRQVAMFLSKRLTPLSLPEIGRKFGGKDHTTVMHAVKRVEQLSAEDAHFAEDVELLTRVLQYVE